MKSSSGILAAAATLFFGAATASECAAISDLLLLGSSTSQLLEEPYPYEFPKASVDTEVSVKKRNGISTRATAALANPDPFPMPECNGVKLEEATIDQMQEWMSTGVMTSVDLVMCYWRRIQQTDDYVRAIMELNPDFLEIAASLDAERAAGTVRGPLHGIPFLVKDNIASKDKMETTAGSWALLGSVVPRDAHVVAKLREAGAVLLGKASMSEWADMRSNDYSEGYSARGGQARSAYNLVVNPGGSSTGSAVSVAVNQIAFALGSETDGSVINPAMRNALVGIKPTVGLTSRAGVVPESAHQDSIGTFARNVRDAVYALDAIYGVDSRDNYTSAQTGHTPDGGYAQFLSDSTALQGAKFGIPWDSFWKYADAAQQAKLTAVIELIETAGATVINGTELPNRDTIVSPDGWNWDYGSVRGFANESEYTVVKVDFYNDIKAYLAELDNTDMRSLEDIVQYNNDNAGSEGGIPGVHPAFASGQDGFLASMETKGVMDETYYQALAFCQKSTREDGIDAALYNNGDKLDALFIPPDVAQAPQIAAQAGYPIITLPVSTNEETGMGYGLGLLGTAWSEAVLVKYASAIEDLKKDTQYVRTLPKWIDYKVRNIPVPW